MNKLTIFCFFHRSYEIPDNINYKVIQVGAKKSSEIITGALRDDIGDNISEKNSAFCELTGMYWVWKNYKLQKDEKIGFAHYRRYFMPNQIGRFGSVQKDISITEFQNRINIDFEHIKQIARKNTLILPKPLKLDMNLQNQYIFNHIREDWEILREIVLELHPQLEENWGRVFVNNCNLHPYNMFITSGEIFSDYMEWLFEILFLVEKRINISKYPYQHRVFGFMAERLQNLFFDSLNIKSKNLPIAFIK